MSSKFCSLKHYQQVFTLHLGTVASCCRAYSEPLLPDQSIQQQVDQWKHESKLLSQGVEIPGCKLCWDDEKQNKLSYRQLRGQTVQSGLHIDILLSNLCNHMCSYCSPRYSSVWEQSISTNGLFHNISDSANKNLSLPNEDQQTQTRLTEISSYIQSQRDNSILLNLTGGEPLMQMQSLKTLLNTGQSKIKILSIVTNLNPPSPKFLEWMLDNFPRDKLQISISLDATPEFNHVPRAGFDHSKFLSNLELLKNQHIKINFSSTISATSIFDLPNFLSWINTHGYSSKFFSLNNPTCLNPEVVPVKFRKKILEKIQIKIPTLVDHILNYNQPIVDLKLFEQYNYLTQYFTRTNTDLTKVNNQLFQEYWQWLTERFKK
jgi:sulfatase maturation enzyme AslB (radical SAM superfamily)